MTSFMVEAEAERLIAMGEELYEEAIFTADIDALRHIGFVRTMVVETTYAEARAKAVAHLRARGTTEGFVLDGIFGAKEEKLITRSGSLFTFIGEL